MAGIYVHIPFCKQACSYCDFYFVTSPVDRQAYTEALGKEIALQQHFFGDEKVETIYFGGGSPSVLEDKQLGKILNELKHTFSVTPDAEVTLEVNPDDITAARLKSWHYAGFNRLSIGIQSFYEDQLRWMNRAHSSLQAKEALSLVQESKFSNYSLDLIFGLPNSNAIELQQTLESFLAFKPPHFSCYALTVEEQTPLYYRVKKGRILPVSDDVVAKQFLQIHKALQNAGYQHYEVSNYAKKGFKSKHNSAYWSGKPYLGLGPGAHGYKHPVRYHNLPNLKSYLEKLSNGKLHQASEKLSVADSFNEFVLTHLRTEEGLKFAEIKKIFGADFIQHLLNNLPAGYTKEKEALQLRIEDWLFADAIAANLFYLANT